MINDQLLAEQRFALPCCCAQQADQVESALSQQLAVEGDRVVRQAACQWSSHHLRTRQRRRKKDACECMRQASAWEELSLTSAKCCLSMSFGGALKANIKRVRPQGSLRFDNSCSQAAAAAVRVSSCRQTTHASGGWTHVI